MVKENMDIPIDAQNDDVVIDGDFALEDGQQDDCKIILGLTTGALKSDPILGPNLVSMINAKQSPDQMIQTIKLHLKRDNKVPKKLQISNGSIDIQL